MASALEDTLKKVLVEDRPGAEEKPQMELKGTFYMRAEGGKKRADKAIHHELSLPGTHVTAACCALFCALLCIVLA